MWEGSEWAWSHQQHSSLEARMISSDKDLGLEDCWMEVTEISIRKWIKIIAVQQVPEASSSTWSWGTEASRGEGE